MPIVSIIESPVSRRTYNKEDINPEVLGELEKLIKKPFAGPLGGKSRFAIVDKFPSNSEEKIRVGTYGMIIGAKSYLVGIIDKEQKKLEDFGYNFEKLILKATELGLGTCWLGAKFTGKSFEERANVQSNEYIPAISPIGLVKDNYNIRESVISWGIRARKRKDWNKLFFSDDFNTPLDKVTNDNFSNALEMVRIAPSGRNAQPWRIVKDSKRAFHFYIQLRTKRSIENLPSLKRMDIGIAMCHFDLTLIEEGIHGKWTTNDPEIPLKQDNTYYIASWTKK